MFTQIKPFGLKVASFSRIPLHSFHKPHFGMVFANAAVSAAQKPCQPFGDRAFIPTRSNMHSIILLVLKRIYAPIAAQPVARRFFPVGACRWRRRGKPQTARPLSGEKQRGRPGFKGSVALSLSRPVTYRAFRRFANASAKPKAVLYSAVLRPGGSLCPPPRMVSRHLHAKSC